MHKEGLSNSEIARQLKISRNSVAAVLKEYEPSKGNGQENVSKPASIPAPTSESNPIPDPEGDASPVNGEGNNPDDLSDIGQQEPIDEDEPTQAKIVDGAEKGFIKMAGSSLAKELLKDLQSNLETAKRIKKYEMLYRADIEEMGFNWLDFLDVALQGTYRQLMNRLKEERQAATQEKDLISSKIKQRLLSNDLGSGIYGR